jgi:hypothetical protein
MRYNVDYGRTATLAVGQNVRYASVAPTTRLFVSCFVLPPPGEHTASVQPRGYSGELVVATPST